MKTLSILTLLACLTVAPWALAAGMLDQEVTVEGDVVSYDATKVTLSDKGKTFHILRSSIPKGTVLKTHQHMKFKIHKNLDAPASGPAAGSTPAPSHL